MGGHCSFSFPELFSELISGCRTGVLFQKTIELGGSHCGRELRRVMNCVTARESRLVTLLVQDYSDLNHNGTCASATIFGRYRHGK